jgi:molybdopterin biosynthesis enzyme
LQRLRGRVELELPTVAAEAAADFVNQSERVHFMRARLAAREGCPTVAPLPRQGSHVISSLTEADCLVEVPACRTIRKGTEVMTIGLG